jgi:hypothetical protein
MMLSPIGLCTHTFCKTLVGEIPLSQGHLTQSHNSRVDVGLGQQMRQIPSVLALAGERFRMIARKTTCFNMTTARTFRSMCWLGAKSPRGMD